MMLVFITGVAVVAYPTVSDYWNSKVQSRAISDYADAIGSKDDSEIKAIKLAAQMYNSELYGRQSLGVSGGAAGDYEKQLNINGDGIMGYIVIPLIDVELPIYHGTDNKILQAAVGHSEMSSLPCGGGTTHSVLLGHRGLPSARLFNDLDQLSHGDYFEIHLLDEVLFYEVYDISIVKPRELDNLRIKKDEDLVTLVTCTPYGINSHRLLIHGRRIESRFKDHGLVFSEARKVNFAYVAVAVGIVLWTLSISVVMYLSSHFGNIRLSRDEVMRRRKILEKYTAKGGASVEK